MVFNSAAPSFVTGKTATAYQTAYWPGYMTAGGLQGISANSRIVPSHNNDHPDNANLGGRNAPSSLRNSFGS